MTARTRSSRASASRLDNPLSPGVAQCRPAATVPRRHRCCRRQRSGPDPAGRFDRTATVTRIAVTVAAGSKHSSNGSGRSLRPSGTSDPSAREYGLTANHPKVRWSMKRKVNPRQPRSWLVGVVRPGIRQVEARAGRTFPGAPPTPRRAPPPATRGTSHVAGRTSVWHRGGGRGSRVGPLDDDARRDRGAPGRQDAPTHNPAGRTRPDDLDLRSSGTSRPGRRRPHRRRLAASA